MENKLVIWPIGNRLFLGIGLVPLGLLVFGAFLFSYHFTFPGDLLKVLFSLFIFLIIFTVIGLLELYLPKLNAGKIEVGNQVLKTNIPMIGDWYPELFTKKTYALSSLSDCILEENTKSKKKRGFTRENSKLNLLNLLLWGQGLLGGLYGKDQRLVLIDHDNSRVAEIDLSLYYEEDIEELIATVRSKLQSQST